MPNYTMNNNNDSYLNVDIPNLPSIFKLNLIQYIQMYISLILVLITPASFTYTDTMIFSCSFPRPLSQMHKTNFKCIYLFYFTLKL